MLLLSAAADLYWLGRYLGRARLLTSALLDCLQNDSNSGSWLLSLTGSWQPFVQQYGLVGRDALAEYYLQPSNMAGLPYSLEAMRADAQSARGVIGRDLFVAVNSLWLRWLEQGSQPAPFASNLQSLQWVSAALAEVSKALAEEANAEAARFVCIGLAIEELDFGLRLLAIPDSGSAQAAPLLVAAQRLQADCAALPNLLWHSVQQAADDLLHSATALPEGGRDLIVTGATQALLQQLTYRIMNAFAA